MNKWQRFWLGVKLAAAVAACGAAGFQAFYYMLDSPDATGIHPLSILVTGLIFGFIIFGFLSLIERTVKRLVARFVPAKPAPQAEHENDVALTEEQTLILPAGDSTQQKQR
jgi:hypothetical protein